ncbi:MAG: respiratory nitrate reductase subunit gamma [Dehalococcoidales bacterium]|jgi:nitrate reductase gamma subunit|nr:respiratory nitrate reductase subunit gamma [Dehalococcoidales bacterium]
MVDSFLFGILPYIAIVIAVGGLIWRYVTNQFSYSSISSQFLEDRQLFWGSMPWHYGIIAIVIGHLIGIFLPSSVIAFNRVPLRLYILEGAAFALGLLALAGLIFLLLRRGTNPRIRVVTSGMDLVLLLLLLFQVITGDAIAVLYRWGTAWFVQTAAPYFLSLAKFSPEVGYMASLPLLVKVHAVNTAVLLAIVPFTRMVHMVTIPVAYLWRPYQVVTWYRRKDQQ